MTELEDFIRQGRTRGMDPGTIRMVLLAAGWKDADVAETLARQTLDLPIPRPRRTAGAWDVFRNLLTFGLLFATLVHAVILGFGILDRLFPDPANFQAWNIDPEENLSGLRFSLATVVVTFPLFLVFSRLGLLEGERRPESLQTPVRRFFLWLTLLVAAVTVLGNLIALLFFFFEGQLQGLTLVKMGLLLVLALSVFAYYRLVMRLEEQVAQ